VGCSYPQEVGQTVRCSLQQEPQGVGQQAGCNRPSKSDLEELLPAAHTAASAGNFDTAEAARIADRLAAGTSSRTARLGWLGWLEWTTAGWSAAVARRAASARRPCTAV
jgi:hypothetical protein